MNVLRFLVALMFLLATGVGLFLVLADRNGLWLLILGLIGSTVSGWPYWMFMRDPEFWEMWRDYFNCRWY